MLQQLDIVPTVEDSDQHVRQVKPGNFRKHLNAAAIERIQDRYRELFETYRYEIA